ncbi:MAG: arginine--tRNA ligase, partial [Planctomycetia bacterium]|nr:arginine--tRNA ligase [Planctomycetia bacterium]
MEILRILEERFAVAVRKAIVKLVPEGSPHPELTTDELLIRPSQNPQFGDYQANLAMPLGKRLHRSPREIASAVVAELLIDDCCEPPTIAGPGFINLRLRTEFLADQLERMRSDERLGVTRPEKPLTIVIDYSSPNCAKPMHVGHIRSTVIGDALYRILTFLGHRVISDNHIGDWGTQFGMILYGYKHFSDKAAYARNPVEELSRLYRLVRKIIDRQTAISKGESVPDDPELQKLSDAHPDINRLAQLETAKLHAGDPENRQLWEEFQPACRDEMERIYRRLHVTFDHTLGESFYQPMLAGIVEEAIGRNVATETEGAVGIFFTREELSPPACDVPMLIRKKDGAFLYATTDLATIRYRIDQWKPDRILYLTDHRQSLHFQQLFVAVRKLGWPEMDLRHVSFGTVLGEDGKPFRTRSGDTIGLESLLDEAVERARAVLDQSRSESGDIPESGER